MNCQSHRYVGHDPKLVTRRWFFQQCGVGLGTVALGHLLAESGYAAPTTSERSDPLAPNPPHHAAEPGT